MVIKDLYAEYQNQTGHNEELTRFKQFCSNCQNDIDKIPDNCPAFISEGDNPVAGIGFGTSELTIDSRNRIKKDWAQFASKLQKIKSVVDDANVKEFSELVKLYRGRTLNLFVNRCIITMHSSKVLSIANIDDLRILFELLKELNCQTPPPSFNENYNNANMKWYENNIAVFKWLLTELGSSVNDNEDLSHFGWYLKERLLKSVSLRKTLENCHNIILTGAPGTGKTYMAKKIASDMNAEYEFVQFHPSYDYTDFVEGLRPEQGTTNTIVFQREDGIFKDFCKNAIEELNKAASETRKPKPFVFIIDEINRGEISKIFGELFFAIDPGYRGKKGKVKTQYQNLIDKDKRLTQNNYPFKDSFYVPENVYIIGTMNDIDRSVESMDFAMRRRFTFVDFVASENVGMLNKITNYDIKKLALKKMAAINNAIIDPKIGKLTLSYQIGGAYFIKINHYLNYEDKWELLWNYHLKGLIYEYYRGDPNADTIVNSIKQEYDNIK